MKDYLFSIKQYLWNKTVCEELKKYHNIHKGERCFVIGTGLSLTVADLDKLKGEITFGSNRIFEIFSQTDWRPTYYMNQDYQLIQKFFEEIKHLSVKRKFLPIEARTFFPDADFSTYLELYVGQG